MGLGRSLKRLGARSGFGRILPAVGVDPFGVNQFRQRETQRADQARALQQQRIEAGQREQLLSGNITSQLSPEQLKDLLLNNPNIITPGGRQFFDPNTNTIRIEESPFQEAQRGRQERLAAELSGSLTGQLPDVSTEAVTQATFQQAKNLLDPEFAQQRRRLEQQLADQGLPPGSEAFNEQINRLERSQGQQLQQLSLGSVLQGVQTGEAQRAARFNEISSLLGQAQVGGVGFQQFQPQKSGLDIVGLGEAARNRAFQSELIRKDRRAAERAALLRGIGSLGSAAIFASDTKLKKNIKIIGLSDSKIPIVEFEYKDKNLYGGGKFQGVLAQDVKKINPKAVINDNGHMKVDYSLIDVEFKKVA